MTTILKRLMRAMLRGYKPRSKLEQMLDREKASVVGQHRIVRDGIEFVFEERSSGETVVFAQRRLKPGMQATFLVFERTKALAWMNDGVLPDDETRELLSQFQAGTWPEPLRSTSSPF